MDTAKKQKLRLGYLTSCRELVKEEVGQSRTQSWPSRVGCLESLVHDLKPGSALCDHFELAAIVCDDTETEYVAAWHTSELWPTNEKVLLGRTLRSLDELATRLPSDWRRLPGTDPKHKKEKLEYETKLLATFKDQAVDIIISDSYMCVIGKHILQAYPRQIINIHPAIADTEDPNRLPGAFPTRDAITRAKYGYIIVDDKQHLGIPEGKKVTVEYEGRSRMAVCVPRLAQSGVTIHFVTSKVDAGPVLISQAYSFEPNTTTEQSLREQNYALKRELLPKALLKMIG